MRTWVLLFFDGDLLGGWNVNGILLSAGDFLFAEGTFADNDLDHGLVDFTIHTLEMWNLIHQTKNRSYASKSMLLKVVVSKPIIE